MAHISLLFFALPVSTVSAFFTASGEESLRKPAAFALAAGTRTVIWLSPKETWMMSIVWPAMVSEPMRSILPTPCAE